MSSDTWFLFASLGDFPQLLQVAWAFSFRLFSHSLWKTLKKLFSSKLIKLEFGVKPNAFSVSGSETIWYFDHFLGRTTSKHNHNLDLYHNHTDSFLDWDYKKNMLKWFKVVCIQWVETLFWLRNIEGIMSLKPNENRGEKMVRLNFSCQA